MTSGILIIRSASIQQLDRNLSAIKARFPSCAVSVLTHSHGAGAVEKYAGVRNVHIYPHKTSFRPGRRVKSLTGRRFDAAVVLTSNATGSGYINVLLFALTLPAKAVYTCNPASELTEQKKTAILGGAILNALFISASIVLTPLAAVILAIIALVRLAPCIWRRGA